MKRKIRAQAICSLAFFLLVSAILLLYIVCFSHLASDAMMEDWVISSVAVVTMDLILFELAAGTLFAVFVSCCGSRKCLMCVLVVL